ncbi:translation initiation factor IF-2-like isoform X2 [Falco naumanni]|uniref:translation initiation factor IF-2-like isoform X2 n=1 Tax=Falco naumanni TaxID=148594 RepID=UPI001ADE809A|nr:translation initiation factor IF-2-like isoform X2 [Falco naumanni]
MAPAALRRPLAGVPAPRRRLGPGGRAPGAAGRGSAPVRPGSAPPDAGAAAVAAYEPHPGAGRARPRPPRGTRSLPVTERRQNWRKTPQEASFRILHHMKKGRKRKKENGKSVVYIGLHEHHVLFYQSSKYLINLDLNNFKPTLDKS